MGYREAPPPLDARAQAGPLPARSGPPGAPSPRWGRRPSFDSDGTFEVDVPVGQVDLVVERGTEYRPLHLCLDAPAGGAVDLDCPLERWIHLPERGWYAGNTHVHYDEKETRALDRLRSEGRGPDGAGRVRTEPKRPGLADASLADPTPRDPDATSHDRLGVGEPRRRHAEP